ncbi:DUF5518 domain-containing protein [Halorubellus salinus]|uniref:DUF5518 domain-containing protein n=1 Tax=Halorubellus salinus TaxID=755309 RepID=UPI001D06309D|nr:DUF5518 domain-containing protein [Halorubellus salinus]
MSSQIRTDSYGTGERTRKPLSRTVDWLVAGFLVLVGAAFVAAGTLTTTLADRSTIASWVADGRLTSTDMTDAELVDATFAVLSGGGVGVALTGVLLVAGGIAFVALQSRARRRFESTGELSASTTGTAILGALVTVAAAFVPFSPVLGGGVAGYLRAGDAGTAVRTGALAGVLATIPVLVIYAAITWTLLGTGSGLTGLIALVFAGSLLVSLAYVTFLSALGGYLGDLVLAGRNTA